MSQSGSSKRYSYWLLFMLCFSILPGLLVAFAFIHTDTRNRENQIRKHVETIGGFYQDLQKFSNSDAFCCNYLNTLFSVEQITAENAREKIETRLAELKSKFGFDYVLSGSNRKIATSSFSLKPRRQWELAMEMLRQLYSGDSDKATEELLTASGKILGPQLNINDLDKSRSLEEPHLVYPDSRYQKPMLWTYPLHNFQILVLISPELMESNEVIWNEIKDFSRQSSGVYQFSIAEKAGFRHASTRKDLQQQIENAYQKHETEKLSLIQTDNFIVFPKFISHKLTLLGYIDKSILKSGQLVVPALLVSILFFAFTLIAGRYSYNLIVKDYPDTLSLRWKLRFLFFFANGLPLLVLFFIGNDFLEQKRDNLLREMHSKGIHFIQDFDEKIELEYSKALISKKRAEKDLIKSLSKEPLNNTILKKFVDSLSKNAEWKVVLTASRSHIIGLENGIVDEKRGIFPPNFDRNDKQTLRQHEYTRKIGQFFLDKINGSKISGKTATEIEMLLESVTQKPMVNFIFDMLRNRGNFLDWGFGRNIHPSILDTFSLAGSKSADYFFVANIRRLDFQQLFLKTYIPQANRNHLGLKILAVHGRRFSVPAEAYKVPAIKEFAETLSTYPGNEIKFVDYKNKRYLAMGFEGKYIKEYKLIGLYPLENIDNLIDTQRQQLIVFAALSLLITLILSQVLSQSFLIPLRLLTTGAQAIENKNFKMRLPDLGRDEFGSMGGIFNDVMIDLEELSVAAAIQEQLLPQQTIETGCFSLFGRSIAMGELGGDYFDYIQVSDNKFSVLLGDVAGHGVGAALIMAMAKAGIIQSDDLLDQPLALVNRLHSLIYASKTKKQRKVMTFQYLCVDAQNGISRYSNAGACSPMIIRKNRDEVEELTLAGAALGAFKKANYSEIEISFEPGDAIVFYTDGIVEARNAQDEEIGYENLKTLLKNCWAEDAEIFYNNIYRAYMQHLGDVGAQDDLTMVILVYTGKPQAQKALDHASA